MSSFVLTFMKNVKIRKNRNGVWLDLDIDAVLGIKKKKKVKKLGKR